MLLLFDTTHLPVFASHAFVNCIKEIITKTIMKKVFLYIFF